MAVRDQGIEQLFREIVRLAPEDRLRLIARVIESVVRVDQPVEPRPLTYGKYRNGLDRLSTEADFVSAERIQ